jgi:hypothetical protein
MPTNPIAGQPAEPDRAREPEDGGALAALASTVLDPLFRPQARSGVASAWHAHVPFAQWLVSATRPGLIVELGTHNGVSYAAFCETVLQEKLPARCYAVDSWTGDDHAGHYDESVYARLRAFHDGRYSAFSELLRMSFDEARDLIADGTVDLLHIDGFHSYDAVRHDFEGWAPKLSARAVVLFHDINVLGLGFGVARFWAEVAGRFPSFAFLHGHGLGVLAVGAEAPPAVLRLCASAAPPDITVLRERFAALGRCHALDYALRERARTEERLRREAADRDAVVETLRGSLEEVLRQRDTGLAAQALADERLAAQEAEITGLRQRLREAQASLDTARDETAGLEASAEDRARQIADRDRVIAALQAKAAEDRAELGRVREETEALWGNLAAARADAKAAREEGRAEAARLQAEIERRESHLPAPGRNGRRPGFSLRALRH